MRSIQYHKINPTNDKLEIIAKDGPGSGGAHHVYDVRCEDGRRAGFTMMTVNFQDGPILENGVNGVTQEVLLAIVIDRLRSFQSGPFSCRENALALTKCEEALQWLHSRTLERMSRGVEGVSEA